MLGLALNSSQNPTRVRIFLIRVVTRVDSGVTRVTCYFLVFWQKSKLFKNYFDSRWNISIKRLLVLRTYSNFSLGVCAMVTVN